MDAEIAAPAPPALHTLTRVRADVAGLLAVDPAQLEPDADLVSFGLDSISVMRLVGAWRREGATVGFAELMQEPTLAAWSRLRADAERGASPANGGAAAVASAAAQPLALPELDETAPFELAPL
jgi:mycobactin phenyloxazoline synthetase